MISDDPLRAALPDDIQQKLIDGRHLRKTTHDLAQRRGISLNEARHLVRRWLFEWQHTAGKGGTDDC